MRWWEIAVRVPPEQAEAVAQAILPYCYGGVAMEPALETQSGSEDFALLPDSPTLLRAYLARDGSFASRRRRLLDRLREAFGGEAEEREVQEEDWASAWRDHFRVQRVGRRLVVKPTWRRHRPRPGDLVIELDPGMAFGTGDHPTTRSCLRLMEEAMPPGARVLDLGTGSGILAIAAARLGAAAVLALDTDPVAVEAARRNCDLNRVGDVVRVAEGSLGGADARRWGASDLVLANLTSQLHRELATGLVGALRPGGVLIGAGIGSAGLGGVLDAYRAAGADEPVVRRRGEWRSLLLRRPV